MNAILRILAFLVTWTVIGIGAVILAGVLALQSCTADAPYSPVRPAVFTPEAPARAPDVHPYISARGYSYALPMGRAQPLLQPGWSLIRVERNHVLARSPAGRGVWLNGPPDATGN